MKLGLFYFKRIPLNISRFVFLFSWISILFLVFYSLIFSIFSENAYIFLTDWVNVTNLEKILEKNLVVKKQILKSLEFLTLC